MKQLLIFLVSLTIVASLFGQTTTNEGSVETPSSQSKKVTFTIKKGAGGCANCGNSVEAMLKDPKMRAELEPLFPENATVEFYVRRHKAGTVIPEKNIVVIVGNCAGAIKTKGDVTISGCGRQIDKNMIFKNLVAELRGKK